MKNKVPIFVPKLGWMVLRICKKCGELVKDGTACKKCKNVWREE